MRARYRLAYSFLSRFVRTIEVMMDGTSAQVSHGPER